MQLPFTKIKYQDEGITILVDHMRTPEGNVAIEVNQPVTGTTRIVIPVYYAKILYTLLYEVLYRNE